MNACSFSKKGKSFMKIRLISGTCYIAILAIFFCLKIFAHDLFFDGLVYLFALIGTFEMLRAMKEKTTQSERTVVFVFSLFCIPACALFEYFFQTGLQMVCVCLFVLTTLLLLLLVFEHEKTSLESLGLSLLSAVYPSLLLALLVVGNHLQAPKALEDFAFNSDLFVLLVFVISPCADTIAYLFGRFLKKFYPKKLAPTLSPNKTVIGGIGGLVGGMVGAGVVYFVYNALCGSFENMAIFLPVYLLIGLLASVATEIGDLVESCIKRKVDLKDMGNVMPGHGGALDRLDGTLFATVAVYFVFALVYTFI